MLIVVVFPAPFGPRKPKNSPSCTSMEKLSRARPARPRTPVKTAVGAKVLRECLDLELMNVWLQPGAESPENLVFLQEGGFNYIADDCIMVQTRLATRHS